MRWMAPGLLERLEGGVLAALDALEAAGVVRFGLGGRDTRRAPMRSAIRARMALRVS
jgi:hypothetical protein